jgi:hypothetical protein
MELVLGANLNIQKCKIELNNTLYGYLYILDTISTMGRNIIIILSRMLEEFPEEITNENHRSLKHYFEKTSDSLTYSPPETINSSYYWNIVGTYLKWYVSQEDYDTIPWIKNVIDIFTDKIKV